MNLPSPSRIAPIVRKELRQIRRDTRSLIFLVVLPAFLLVLYGFALNFDFRRIPLAVCDQDGTPASRDFLRRFTNTEYFDLKAVLADPREADGLLGRETVRVALVVPHGFARRLERGEGAEVQVLADGSSPTAAGTAVGYVSAIAQGVTARLTAANLARAGVRMPAVPVRTEPRVWYNPELRSANFLVPGLMAFILMGILVVSTSFAVVREKERGTMEQIMVSPVLPQELVIGKTIPYVGISLVSTHLVLLLGMTLFRVPLSGSYLLLLLIVVLFLLGALAQGVLISAVTRTQQVAFIASAMSSFLPTFILSGFVFPIRNMPVWVQAVTYLVPARYFLAALRGIMLKAAGFHAIWKETALLFAFAFGMIALSTFRLKRGLMEPAEPGGGRKRRGRRGPRAERGRRGREEAS